MGIEIAEQQETCTICNQHILEGELLYRNYGYLECAECLEYD